MFAWTRKLIRTESTAKPQSSLRFKPAMSTLEDRLQPAALPGLGAASQFAVLGVNRGDVEVIRATVDGNIGLGPRVDGGFRQANATGLLVADPTARPNLSFRRNGFEVSQVVRQNLTQAAADANTASAAYAAMPATQTFGNLTKSLSITGTGGTNIVRINSVNFSRGDMLTLAGGPNDVFVLNVAGKFQFHSGAIQLGVGVTPNHVVFNFPTTGGTIEVSGENSVFKGTILAPNRSVEDTRTGNFTGAIIARDVTVRSGDNLHADAFTPPSAQNQTLATLSGHVLSNSPGLLGSVTINLTGTDLNGAPVFMPVTTDPDDGSYTLLGIAPGNYNFVVDADLLPGGFSAVGDAANGAGVQNAGTNGDGGIYGIALGYGDAGTFFNFSVNLTNS